MEKICRIRKYVGLLVLLGALLGSLTGCFSNLQDIFGTPTPSPTPNPDIVIDPEIGLDPIGGYSGTLVKVNGEGWMPGKLVILKMQDEEGRSDILAANIPDEEGLFTASFNYPSSSRWLTPGFNTVIAYALNEDLETTAQFVVIEPSATATSETPATPAFTATPTNTSTSTFTQIPTATLTRTPTVNAPTVDAPTETATVTNTPTWTSTPFEFLLLPTSTATLTASVPLVASPTATTSPTEASEEIPTATFSPTFTPEPTTIPESTPTLEPTLTQVPPTQTAESELTTPETDSTIINAEQITEPSEDDSVVSDSLPDDSAVDDSAQNQDATPTVIVVSIAPTGTVPITELSNTTDLSATVSAPGPLSSLAEPTPTPAGPTVTPTWTPQPQVVVIEEWRGDYWPNTELAGPAIVIRNEQEVNFNWGSSSPAPEVPIDNFSARWTRTLGFSGGIYTFAIEIDDGARLYVDGQLLIDSWQDQARRTLTAQKILSEGQHQVVLEYYERTGNAIARLGWEGRATFQGWRGEYFANTELNGRPILVRDDPAINFEWGVDSPAPVLPEDGFSVKWQRRVNLSAGAYLFRASADDGIRVWVDDLLLIDEWRDQSEQEFTAELVLTEGSHDIRVEYYESTLGAIAKFSWEEVVTPTLAPTPTWTPAQTPSAVPTPTWTPAPVQPTPTWTPAN